MAPTAFSTEVIDAVSVLVDCQVKRNWPDGPATSMRVPPSGLDFLEVSAPLLMPASVTGVSMVTAKDDAVARGQLSANVVSAPSRRSGIIRLSDNVRRSPAVPATHATKPPCCGSKSRYSSLGFCCGGALLLEVDCGLASGL